jgi:putative spermidine/putrescine transport system ATP-binding protein
VVEQSAAPRDIYDAPHSPYVARFMGGQNALKGRLEGTAGNALHLIGPEGTRFSVPGNGAAREGQEVRFAVRRDRIEISRTPRTEVNAMPGTVVNVEYQGTFVKVGLMTPSREEFVVYLSDAAYFRDSFTVGQNVHVHWAAEHAHLLAGQNDSSGVPHVH